MLRILLVALLVTPVLVTIVGCESRPRHPAAPLNDRTALEKLASAYKTVSETLAVSPVKLRAEARRKFVEQVFAEAGYDYTLTLVALAGTQPAAITQYHKDMKELLYLPHYGMKFEEVKDIYTDHESRAIQQIDNHFRQ